MVVFNKGLFFPVSSLNITPMLRLLNFQSRDDFMSGGSNLAGPNCWELNIVLISGSWCSVLFGRHLPSSKYSNLQNFKQVIPREYALNLKIIFIGEHQIEYSLCFLVFSLGLQIWSHSTIYLVSLSMYLMVSRFGSREYF